MKMIEDLPQQAKAALDAMAFVLSGIPLATAIPWLIALPGALWAAIRIYHYLRWKGWRSAGGAGEPKHRRNTDH